MKITLYTIKDCVFSKQEKEYLKTNKLAFEEKDLEANKDFLTEMLAISNNFAGTPVTRVEKDDGSISVLKGFTKEEFDTAFGFTASPATPPVESTPPINDTPITTPPVVETLSTPPITSPTETVSPAPVPTPTPVEAPPIETPIETTPDPLKSVMDDLQAQVEQSSPPPPITNNQPVTSPPVDAPTIPDFPAK